MKNEKLFRTTLNELQLKNIFTTNFTEEQIFYQLQKYTGERLREIELQINSDYRKFYKIHKDSIIMEEDKEESSSYEYNSQFKNFVSSKYSDNIKSDLSDANSEAFEQSEESDVSSLNYDTEEECSFSRDIWEQECSEDDELVNLPASEIVKILNSKTFDLNKK